MGKWYLKFDIAVKTVIAAIKIYNTSYMCQVIYISWNFKEQSSS
jgi:hypothetical protein